MTLGAEPKKVGVLVALLAVAGYFFYTNVLSDSGPSGGAPSSAAPARPAAAPTIAGLPEPPSSGPRAAQKRQLYGRQTGGDFKISLKYQRPEDRPDPMKVDPTLRLDLISKLQNVTIEGGHRSLFEFSKEPPPPPAAPKAAEPKILVAGTKDWGRIYGPLPKPVEAAKTEPPKPPPTPIPLKFYGFSAPKGGVKRAFFLEGTEDIHVAGEGEIIKKRYRVVKIGLNSVVMEDIEQKNEQTLPLEEVPQQANAG